VAAWTLRGNERQKTTSDSKNADTCVKSRRSREIMDLEDKDLTVILFK
jgi:hypothetical protein